MTAVIRFLIGVLFTLLVILALGIFWLTATGHGARFAVKQAVTRSGQPIQMEGVEGNLLTGLQVAKLRYTLDGGEYSAEQVALDYSFLALREKRVVIDRLSAAKVVVTLPPSKDDTPSGPLIIPAFASPVPVELHTLDIGELTIHNGANPIVLKKLHLAAAMEGDRIRIDALSGDYEPYSVESLQGEFQLAEGNPLRLEGKARSLTDDSTLNLVVEGKLQDYGVSAIAALRLPDVPPADLQLSGRGTLESLHVESLQAAALEGSATVSGDLGWKDGFRADLTLAGRQINPGVLMPDYAGKLDIDGSLALEGARLRPSIGISGTLRDYPVDAQIDAIYEDMTALINRGRVAVGPNTLTLNGMVDPKHAQGLSFEIEAPQLDALHPQLKGAVSGKGNADGQWTNPTVDLDLKGKQLRWQTFAADALSLSIKPQSSKGQYAVNGLFSGLQAGEQRIGETRVTLTGDLRHQAIQLDLKSAPYGIDLSTQAETQLSQDMMSVSGNLHDTLLRLPDWSEYRQTGTAQFSASAESQNMRGLCLRGTPENVCVDGEFDATGEGSLVANLKDFPLKHLKPWLPQAAQLNDSLSAEANLKGKNSAWHLDAVARLDEANYVDAKVDLDQAAGGLGGTLATRFDKLDWINLFSDQIVNPKGILQSDLRLSGTLGKPVVEGDVRLANGQLRIPAAGTEFKDIRLDATLQADQTARFEGELHSGKGTLALQGRADLSQLPRWSVDATVNGKDFEAVNIPVVKATVNPDLAFKGDENGLALSGQITLPKADISLGNLPESTVTVSPDAVIVGDGAEAGNGEGKVSMPFGVDVRLALGDKVHVSGYGLEADLGGGMRLSQPPGRLLEADGTIRVSKGTYQSFGQDLTIRRGEFYFNGPLDQPGINIEAVRVAGTVTAGLRLTGSLAKPTTSVFSVPTLSDTEAMSYLLTGKSLSSASESDSNALINAAAKLGLARSEGIIEDIRAKTGFDTLSVDAADGVDKSALLIGKRLSSRLYVEYAVKLFDESNLLSLTYDLSRYLKLQAESGKSSQGIDLIWEIEK